MKPSEYIAFLNSLKVGDKIGVYEGRGEPNVLTKVTSVTVKYIEVAYHPGVKFDRQNGDDLPAIKNCSTYRHLFSPVES